MLIHWSKITSRLLTYPLVPIEYATICNAGVFRELTQCDDAKYVIFILLSFGLRRFRVSQIIIIIIIIIIVVIAIVANVHLYSLTHTHTDTQSYTHTHSLTFLIRIVYVFDNFKYMFKAHLLHLNAYH